LTEKNRKLRRDRHWNGDPSFLTITYIHIEHFPSPNKILVLLVNRIITYDPFKKDTTFFIFSNFEFGA
jgi:hypothetical protein